MDDIVLAEEDIPGTLLIKKLVIHIKSSAGAGLENQSGECDMVGWNACLGSNLVKFIFFIVI